MANMSFNYLYRDGSNFKKWSGVVFSNPDGMTPEIVTSKLRSAWGEDGLFIAHQVRVPDVFLYGDGDANADDHCFHEFENLTPTSEIPNDPFHRSIRRFIAEVQKKERLGWPVFDPFDRSLRSTRRLRREI